jgi:FO synthase
MTGEAMQPRDLDEALALLQLPHEELLRLAAARRDARWGRRVTWSPKVFLPLTNLCRDRCDYCSFRRSPGEAGAWTMTPDEVCRWLDDGRKLGCAEALFCLGDKP